MKTRIVLSSLVFCLSIMLVGQFVSSITHLGQAIDNSAVYAQLQQQKTQAEAHKSQLLTQYAQLQALSQISPSQLFAEGYINISSPLVLTAPATALASNLPEESRLE